MDVATHYAVIGEGTHQLATASGVLHAIIGYAADAEATLYDSGTGTEDNDLVSNPQFAGGSQRLEIEAKFTNGLYWVQANSGFFTVLWSE